MKQIGVYQIDSGVPVPGTKAPLDQLKVGESFVIPIDRRRSVATVASRMKHETGKSFTIRKIDDENIRIWRVT